MCSHMLNLCHSSAFITPQHNVPLVNLHVQMAPVCLPYTNVIVHMTVMMVVMKSAVVCYCISDLL